MEDEKKEQEVKPADPQSIMKELLEKGVIEVKIRSPFDYDSYEDYDDFMGRYWA